MWVVFSIKQDNSYRENAMGKEGIWERVCRLPWWHLWEAASTWVPCWSNTRTTHVVSVVTFFCIQIVSDGFPGGTSGKNMPANAGDTRDSWVGKIPWSRKWPPLQYSCLENSMGRGAWCSTAHGAAKSQTLLSNWTHTQCLI